MNPELTFPDEKWRRFLSKFVITDDCWTWEGTVSPEGYGQFFLDGKARGAHRISYERFAGPIPDSMELDHLCRNPRCIRPDHLEPVTHRENLRRSDRVTGLRSAKAHCPAGHAYDEANTYLTKANRRMCRACMTARTRARRERQRVAA